MTFERALYSVSPHYISNSGKDENGKYSGGLAGDQSGHEWEIRKWYNRPWTCVLRFADITAALTIARFAFDAANNDAIGYDQDQRLTFWKQLEKSGYNPANITTKCEEDCSAGVAGIIKATGYYLNIQCLKSISPSLTSRNMKSALIAAGFTALTASKYTSSPNYLLPGDILLYENHHVATNISYGCMVTPTTGDTVLVTGKSVHIRLGPSTTYKSIAIAHAGDIFAYLGSDSNNWHNITYSTEYPNCWISGRYSKLVN